MRYTRAAGMGVVLAVLAGMLNAGCAARPDDAQARQLYTNARAAEGDQAPVNPAEARDRLKNARDMYYQALDQHPGPELEGLIHAGIANTSYWLDDYTTAAAEWARAYPQLQDPTARSWALYRIGVSQQRFGRFESADQTFDEVQRQFPNTEAASKARMRHGYRGFTVQLATFASAGTAESAVNDLRKRGVTASRTIDPAGHTVVSVGPIPSYSQAVTVRTEFAGSYPNAVIVP